MFQALKRIAKCILYRMHGIPVSPNPDGEIQMYKPQYPRTLFVLKYREHPYGDAYAENGNWGDGLMDRPPLSSGLFNSARMVVDMLERNDVPVKLVHVWDNNYIHREIVAFKAEVVIIEAFWVVPEKFDELRQVCPHVKFVIRNHSEVPFLSNEGMAFDWMLKYARKPNVYMSANAPRMLEDSRFLIGLENPEWSEDKLRERVPFLPNYYPAHNVPAVDVSEVQTIDTINIGCFGAVRPLKNTMLQAVAALKFADRMGWKLRFHINGNRIEMGGSPILKNLFELFGHYPQHELISHPWLPHQEFRALIASMDYVMQVTFSETFNIVSADAITANVPTITSPEIQWSAKLMQADPTSSDSMAEALFRAYELKQANPEFNPSLHGLRRYDELSEREWLPFLASLKQQ